MKRYTSLFTVIVALVSVFGAACATTPTTPALQESAASPLVDRGIPAYRPLELSDSQPAVEQLGEADGTYGYRIGNLTVLHKPTPANAVVAAQLYILGGSTNLTEHTAGIEQLALSVAANGGTQTTPKDSFNTQLDSVGSSIGSFVDRDYSGYALRSVLEHFDLTWDLFVQAVLEPAMLHDEVELRRARQLAEIRSMFENPDRHVGFVATQLLFENHPYSHLQLGTLENVEAFTAEELRAYQRAMVAPEKMLLVVVGDVAKEQLIEKVQASLGRLPTTGSDVREPPALAAHETRVRVEPRELPTNYIFGLFPAPTLRDADYAPMLLATRHLRDRLFEEIRTKRNLTYAVSAGLANQRINYGFLYVTAVDPGATLPVMMQEVERLKQEPLSDDELEEVRNVFVTRHYMELETNASQAAMLARAYLIAGDWLLSTNFLERIQAVSPADIQRAANTYFDNYHFGIVGSPEDVPETLFHQ